MIFVARRAQKFIDTGRSLVPRADPPVDPPVGARLEITDQPVDKSDMSDVSPESTVDRAAPVGRGTLRTLSVLWGHPTNIEATGNPS